MSTASTSTASTSTASTSTVEHTIVEEIAIKASAERVFEALTDPGLKAGRVIASEAKQSRRRASRVIASEAKQSRSTYVLPHEIASAATQVGLARLAHDDCRSRVNPRSVAASQ
jgi:hypothetical protein